MSDCYQRLHDFGSGHGAHQPLAEGETQMCRACGMTRIIRRGRLHYFRRRTTQKKAA